MPQAFANLRINAPRSNFALGAIVALVWVAPHFAAAQPAPYGQYAAHPPVNPMARYFAPADIPAIPTLAAEPAPHVALARPRGPLARLVRNPDVSGGLPPYALADQAGVIQRHVDPAPGIDLEPYVDTVVTVRHDTGRTLLASQLDLPPPPPPQHSGGLAAGRSPAAARRPEAVAPAQRFFVQPVQFVDDDDAELLPDGGAIVQPDESTNFEAAGPPSGGDIDLIAPMDPHAELPMWTDESSALGQEPMYEDPLYQEHWPRVEGCPECGDGFGDPSACVGGVEGPRIGGIMLGSASGRPCRLFADVEMNFLRLHMMEDALGKLSEQYDFSPTFIVGFEGFDLSDGRVRYWTYGRETALLGGGGVRFEFDVWDIEATQRFTLRRSDVVLGAGLRLAQVEFVDDDDDAVGSDLLGMTLAADVRTWVCKFQRGEFAWVYGGRLSILGGDWGGSPTNDLIAAPVRDDNVVVHELYAGLEYAMCYRGCNLRGRLTFEMQNWHSDVLSNDSPTDTIGLLGPGVQLGADF